VVDRYFGSIPSGDPVPDLPGNLALPPVIGETVEVEVEGDVPLPRVYLGVRVPPLTSPDFQVCDVASTVLGGGKASRLYRSLVREKRVAKDVLSYLFPLQASASLLLFWVTGFPESEPETLREALLAELEDLASVTQGELDRAVALSETHLMQSVQQVGTRADLLSMFDQVFDDPSRLNTEVERIRAVTRAQIEDFGARFLGPDNRAFLTYVPGDDR
jgi:zinc protease